MADIQATTPTTRRAILAGIASTAAATAALAVPAIASAATDVDAVLEAWRAWWALGQERKRLYLASAEIERTMPDELLHPRIFLFHSRWAKEDVYGKTVADIYRAWPDEMAGPDFFNEPAQLAKRQARRSEKLLELERAQDEARADRERLGYEQLERRAEETFDEQYALEEIIENSDSAAPAAIVAKLSLALSRVEERSLSDFQWGMVCSVIASLLPSLPTDMAAAMAPIAAGDDVAKTVSSPRPAAVAKTA